MALKSDIVFDSTIGKLDHLAGAFIHIPASIVNAVGGIGKTRLICTLDDSLSFQAGLVALGQGEAYILLNRQRLKQLHKTVGDTLAVKLAPDNSTHGLDLPEEFEEVLKQDPEGAAAFNALTPGKRRYLIYYTAQVKDSQKRVDRALLIVKNLKILQKNPELPAILGKSTKSA